MLSGQGDLAQGATEGITAPLGPGQPIYQRALPKVDDRSQHPPFDDPAQRACATSRSGHVWNTAAMGRNRLQSAARKSFFPSLKTERARRKPKRTRQQARADTSDDIKRFRNPTPRHSPSTDQTLRRSSKKLPKSNSNSTKYTEGHNVAFALSSISACSVKQSEDEHRSD